MSVIKSKRGPSSAQFLETALQIQIFTLRQCVKFPKRYRILFTQYLTESATHACALVKKGKEGNNMSNSSLVDCTRYSPNHSGKRTHAIDTITPHCVVGQLSAERIGDCFPEGRDASCNYGIGYDGRVCLIVDECNRSWCSSSNANDQRAITIECASDKAEPYTMNNAVYNKLVALCVDICKRHKKKEAALVRR